MILFLLFVRIYTLSAIGTTHPFTLEQKTIATLLYKFDTTWLFVKGTGSVIYVTVSSQSYSNC